jgi:mRNA-degrading endonuclease toxin of MazEF toxin-antitoxin module
VKRGAIHWANLEKRRPVVVISPEKRNRTASDVIVLPCSGSARMMAWHVPLRRGEGGLPQDSMVRCESIVTVHKQWIEPVELGVLSDPRIREIELVLLSALGIDLQSH